MFRPLTSPATRPARRGAILIVVLALLALFAVIALFFVFYADAEATNSRIMREAEANPGSDTATIDQLALSAANYGFGQILLDFPDSPQLNQISGLKGHSLVASMYTRLPGTAQPFSGIGTFHENSPAGADRAQWTNYSAFLTIPSGANAGTYIVDPEWTGSRNTTQGANWFSNPPGAAGQTFVPKNAPYTYPDLNNYILSAISQITGEVLVPSMHRPWLFDLTPPPSAPGGTPAQANWFDGKGRIRTVRPRPVDNLSAAELTSLIGTGTLPSTLTPAQANSLATYIKQQIAQGSLIGYIPPNADGSFTGDVQNLQGGVGVQKNDSILIDIGMQPKMWNGKLIKPLVSILVSDLDGLLNLNVHGNTRNNFSKAGSTHVSYAGVGPHEVNLNNLLGGEADALVSTRYGSAGVAQARNGGPINPTTGTRNNHLFVDQAGSRLPVYSFVNFDSSGLNPQFALPSFGGSNAFQVSPSYGAAGFSFYDDNVNDPTPPLPAPPPPQPDLYDKYANHPSLFNPNDWGVPNPVVTGPVQTFSLGDFKRLNLRYAANLDWYQQTNLSKPLGLATTSLIGTFPANGGYRLDPAHGRRMFVTMRSSNFDRPGLLPNFMTVQQGSALQLNTSSYPNQTMYPQNPMVVYPGQSPTVVPATPGPISDFAASNFRHQRAALNAGLGGIDLNRPLASYYGPSAPPTPGTPPTNLTQAWADRHNLARDIFARLIVATGAVATVSANGDITLPQPTGAGTNAFSLAGSPNITQLEYNALRYLAQLAVNIVDYIDNDDISTPFIWNPPSGVLVQVNDVTTLQANLTTSTNNTNAVSDRLVFGVEKSKLVINEAYGEIANDPTELTTDPANGATKPAHVRFWIELLNPGNTPYANSGSGPQGGGSAQVRYDPALGDAVPGAYNPYKIVITRNNAVGGQTVRQYLQDPTNVLGNHLPTGTTAADIDYDFTNANGNAGSRIVSPNNGQYGPSLTPAQGCLVVGPTMPAQGAGPPGPQTFEFNPQPGAAPWNVAPWTQMIQSPTPPAAAAPNAQNAMEYLIPNANFPTAAQLLGQSFAQHIVLLRRLANPYLQPNDPAGAFNPALPPNPYITVDFMDYVPAFDAINRTTTDMNTARVAKTGNPPTGAGYDPIGYRFSVGKIQPFAGQAGYSATPPTFPLGGTLPSASYSYLTSCVLPQLPTGFNQATSSVPAFTFGRHNGTQNTNNYTGTAPNNTLPGNVGETIMAPFEWLVHFDRPLVNQLELLQVQAGKQHEVSQLAILPPIMAANPYRTNLGLAAWLGVNPTGQSGYDLTNNRTNNGLFRALDVLRVKPWMYGVGSGGRTQGQVNLNSIPHPLVLQALADPTPMPWVQGTSYSTGSVVSNGSSVYFCTKAGTSGANPGPAGNGAGIADGSVLWNYNRPAGNAFYTSDVNNFWNSTFYSSSPTPGVSYRTQNTRNTNLADGTALQVPIPGITVDDASPGDPNIAAGLYDRPFKPFGYPEYTPGGAYGMSGGSGLQDTILRVTSAGTPMSWVANPTLYPAAGSGTSVPHQYFKSEMVRKIMNNATTTSNAFAVSLTVVFYEVRMSGGSPVYISEAGGAVQRPALGKEASLNVPGDLRQQFFAVIDRTNLTLQPPGSPPPSTIIQTQPVHGALEASPFAPPGRLLPIVGATQGTNPSMPAVPSVSPPYQPPLGPVNIYLANVVPTGAGQPYTKSYSASTTLMADGAPVTIGPGTILVVGAGANQEAFTVNYANEDGSLNVTANPTKLHAVGEWVSNCLLGNPGIPGFTGGLAPFDRFTNPNSIYFSPVPYAKRVVK